MPCVEEVGFEHRATCFPSPDVLYQNSYMETERTLVHWVVLTLQRTASVNVPPNQLVVGGFHSHVLESIADL